MMLMLNGGCLGNAAGELKVRRAVGIKSPSTGGCLPVPDMIRSFPAARIKIGSWWLVYYRPSDR